MQESTKQLPITAVAGEVCDRLRVGNVVLQAEPGAGKSTGLPLYLLEAGLNGKILMLEPRRIAAMNVAARLASQLGEPVGKTVGLRMRGKTRVSAQTRIEVVTEGVLTRLLQADPLMDGVSVIIFDEFHERSLHADLGLALSLDVQRNLRDDLRLLLMSATLDGEQLCGHIGVDKPVTCTVRQHPVDIVWCGDSRDALEQTITRTTRTAMDAHDGDVLVFLPGVAEIERTARVLEPYLPENTVLCRLHGRASEQQQREATAKGGAQRRVILSTSIAETSITIDGVRIVIDAGVERRSRIDSASGAEKLETVMASQASATQRAGRAGRTSAGVCYRLWSEEGHGRRAPRWQPELLRADLSPLLIEIARWGAATVDELPWIDAPPEGACLRASQLLQKLGLWHGDDSTDGSGIAAAPCLTPYGRRVAQVPLHPRLGHMLHWAAQHNATSQAAVLATLLEDRPSRRGADLTPVISSAMNSAGGNTGATARVRQLKQTVADVKPLSSVSPPLAVLLAQAYPDRIGKRRAGADARYQLSSGSGAVLGKDDALAQSEWLVAAELGGAGRDTRIFSALPVELHELVQWCENLIDTCERVDWDDSEERVVAEYQLTLGALVLESKPLDDVSREQRIAALLSAVQRKGIEALNISDEMREWQARVSRMRSLEGDDTALPAVDDATLLATLPDWLGPWLATELGNRATLKALQQVELLPALNAMLDYNQQQQLDAWFPRKYQVPSGNRHTLRYACDGNPVLAVKLQEMFGCQDTPAVAGGRVKLKIELLSPARRPVQITEDLPNFWHNSYPAVKKDLSGRYPKHPWPDDPLSAEATARAKPRKK
jgi:ATP-dependent helicase HrpB